MYKHNGQSKKIKSATQTVTVPGGPTATPAPPTATPTATPTPTPPAAGAPGTVTIGVTNQGHVSWSFTPPAGVNSVGYVVQWNEHNHIVYNVNSFQIFSYQWIPGRTYTVYVTAWYKHGVQSKQIKSATQTITVPVPTATPAPPTATPTPAPPTATPVPTPSISVTDTGYVTWSFTPPAGVNSVSYVVQWNEQNHMVKNTNSFQIFSHQWIPGQTYAVYVRAWYTHNGQSKQIKSATQTITVPLPTATPTATPTPTTTPTPTPPAAGAPGTVTIGVTNQGHVSWSFTPPTGVTSVSYVVQWNEQNHLVKNTNSYQISGLTPGATYAVYVRAMYTQGGELKQVKSATVSITVPVPTATPTPAVAMLSQSTAATPTPPAAGAPGTVTIGVTNQGHVSWSFTPPTGVTSVGYIVDWGGSNHIVYNVNSYQIPGLTPGTTYAVSVTAVYAQGSETKTVGSSTKSITVPLPPTATPTTAAVAMLSQSQSTAATPTPVASVSMSVSNTGAVSWTVTLPTGASFEDYGVRWKQYQAGEALDLWTGSAVHTITSAGTTSYQLPNLGAGTEYKVRVSASYQVDGLDYSLVSDTVRFTTPGAVTVQKSSAPLVSLAATAATAAII